MTTAPEINWDDLPVAEADAEERQVLGAMLWSPAIVDACAEIIIPEDFWRPAHQVIYAAIVTMNAGGEPVDALTVREWIDAQGELQALGGHQAGAAMLVDLYTGVGLPSVAAAISHARIVRDRALRRRIDAFLLSSRQTVAAGASEPPLAIIARLQEMLDTASAHADDEADPLARQMTGRAFIGRHRLRRPALIPGVLHELDRLVVVGMEGKGKSMLLEQIGVAAVAGIHPFLLTPTRPARVLRLDLENPTDLQQDRAEALMELGSAYPDWDYDAYRVWSHPAGLNLRDPADLHRLAANIRQARPDLVLAGPVKKMYHDSGETKDHSMVCEAWDRLRTRFGFALVLEHHMPAGNIRRPDRPSGSGIWMSWPESGVTLKPAGKDQPPDSLRVSSFRGHRRPGIVWPERLDRPLVGKSWPWQAVYPAGTLTDQTL